MASNRTSNRMVKETIFGNNEWLPVNHHKTPRLINEELITLFVKNIPEEATPTWLLTTFTKFGIVKRIYMPKKRSAQGSRFAFVTYNCSVSADVAISRTNGMIFGRNKLLVKIASYNPRQSKGSYSQSESQEI